jgi:protein TonB
MTALTFESFNNSPRRAAIRRNARPVLHVVPVQPAATLIRKESDVIGRSNKTGLIALVGLAVVVHAGLFFAIHQAGPIETVKPKLVPLTIDIAPPPPPPPPPEVKPKPLPQIAKPVAAPVKAAPPLPVVHDAPATTDPSADTVQVATSAAPVTAPVAAAPERVTAPRGFIGYKSNPPPEYPPEAQRRRLQGRGVLNVHVLATGKPGEVTVTKSSGSPILDDAFIKTIMTSWVFEPGMRGDTPVDGWVKVPFNFQL